MKNNTSLETQLRDEIDELRAQNIELKKLLVSVDKERLELYRALEQVEFELTPLSPGDLCIRECPWCGWHTKHAPDCIRQKALGKA